MGFQKRSRVSCLKAIGRVLQLQANWSTVNLMAIRWNVGNPSTAPTVKSLGEILYVAMAMLMLQVDPGGAGG